MKRQRQDDYKNIKFSTGMQKKLVVLFIMVLLAFVGLTARLILINKEDGEKYKKQVLSQQEYDSKTIPFRRGDILDSKGTKLAVSEKVYNVILDAKIMLSDNGKYVEPTVAAAQEHLGIDGGTIRQRLASNPTSSYYVLAKKLTYEQISGFKELQADTENGKNIAGIWFEEEYKRKYPNNSLASDIIGFTRSDNSGLYGLEEYYNDTLSGTQGREYGYMNNDDTLERTTISAVDGNSIVTTIDANIQSIVEKYLKKFDDEYKNGYIPEKNGSDNVSCIVMDVNTGEVLAMASYPPYDLNNPRDTSKLIGRLLVDELGNKVVPVEYITQEKLAVMDDTLIQQNLNSLWRNYCINDTYEPGSVMKPLTVAAAIDSGKITGNESYQCNGKLHVGDYDIACHNTYGDGLLTVAQGVERSCNVVMMNIGMAMGKDTYIDYQHIFNLGLKTNIDLSGESRTLSLVYNKDTMGPTELATNTFGQGFNCTMIQMISAFCSVINGGKYYEPHMVSKIVSPSGATIQNIEPRLLKQTISESTSKQVKEYCNLVVSGEKGTGKTARPAGYMIGGKTGTAQTLPRGNNEFVLSFLGYAPTDNPQIAIYVVVDRPNVWIQDTAKFATVIVRNVLTEILPYLGIPMTEELTDKEREELEALQIEIMTPVAPLPQEGEETVAEDGTGESGTSDSANETENGENADKEADADDSKQEDASSEIWKTFPIDPETGYATDPNTGAIVDPNTGTVLSGTGNSYPSGLGNTSGNGSTSESDKNPF